MAASSPSGAVYLSLVGKVLKIHNAWSECEQEVKGVSGAQSKKCRSLDEQISTVKGWGLSPELLGTPSSAPATSPEPEPTDSFVFFRDFLPEARRTLVNAGFGAIPSLNPAAAYRLRDGQSIVEAYPNGRVHRQGQWSLAQTRAWLELPETERGWLAERLAEVDHEPMLDQPNWNKDVYAYLNVALQMGRLNGLTGDQVGRHLAVADSISGNPVGIIGENGWSVQPSPVFESQIWRAVVFARRQPDRLCAAIVQRSDASLSLAAHQLTPVGQWLAIGRDWETARTAPRTERLRIVAQVELAGCVQAAHWNEQGWRSIAIERGNQLDVVYDWLSQAALQGARRASLPETRPLEVVLRPPGNDDWAQRLLDQRTDGRVRFRRPILTEEEAGIDLATFVANVAGGNEDG